MRIRFSIKRLLALALVVSVLLYVFVLRPTIVAKRFGENWREATRVNMSAACLQLFGVKAAHWPWTKLTVKYHDRDWVDILTGKQRFTFIFARRKEDAGNQPHHLMYFYSTPLRVFEQAGYFFEFTDEEVNR